MTRRATADDVRAVLSRFVSRVTAASIARSAADRAGLGAARFERLGPDASTLGELKTGVALFVAEEQRAECLVRLGALALAPSDARTPAPAAEAPPAPRQVIAVRDENGIVDARTQARLLAANLGFGSTAQYKIATAVSELSRNMFRYAGGGVVEIEALVAPRAGVSVVARDEGPGIVDLGHVLSGAYRSRTG
ncbi:MAG TPA: hypothetical protein VGM56_00305, partial [Byssovorax sp.]